MSFATVIIVFCCSSREGEKKRLKLREFYQLTQRFNTLSLTIPQEVIKLSSNRQWVSRNICLASRKVQEETLSLQKSRRNTTLAKQMRHWKCEGVCFVLSEMKDQAGQILAVQNVLILNYQIEQKVIRGVQSYITP